MKQVKTYDCGVRLINEFNPSNKTVNISFSVASGSGFDLPQKEGIAHYFEHMFFKSTKKRNTKNLLQEMDFLGGFNNAYTSYDRTSYYGKVINEDAEQFFEILSDCFFNGEFKEEEMETEKGVVCSEIDKYEDDFMDCNQDALYKELFKGTNYSHPVLGSKSSVMSITSDDLKEYRRKNNGPGKLIVSVFGGIPFEKADEFVQKYVIPNYHTKEEPVFYKNSQIKLPQTEKRVVTTEKDTKQVYFIASRPTIRMDNPDYMKIQIASAIFGGTMSSRLFERMREKEGIVYYVGSYITTLPMCGNHFVSFITERGTAERAIKAYYDEVQKIINDGFTEKEFQNAIHMFKTNLLMKEDDVSVKFVREATNYLYDGFVEETEDLIEKVCSLKLDDINKTFINLLKQESAISLVLKDKNDSLLKLIK